jgi:aldehyde dehydrogenase (NAD+)
MTETPSASMTINGAAAPALETIDVVNPATGRPFAKAPDCTREQLDAAVGAARAAQPAWAAKSWDERRAALQAMAGALFANKDELKRLFTAEQGKPYADAEAEIMGAAYWLTETAKLELPDHVVEDSDERYGVVRRVPIGVVAGIVPWNFPIILAAFKLGPALLTGNTLVLKPSPTTPLTTLKVGELLRDVLPPGVLNVVSGGDRLGPWLTAHPGIDKVSFTGSTQTGRKIMEAAASSLKRITLELGGNDAAIVLPDIDVQRTAPELFWAAFRNTGQICIATKRMYIHEDVYEPLKQALVEYASTVVMGDGSEQGVQMGPLQNAAQHRRVTELIADSEANGHAVIRAGQAPEGEGYFVPVTFVDNPPEDSRIVVEEQFGPVLPLLAFREVDDAVARANASEYGLGASVWSGDPERAEAVADRLQAGTVWVNETQHLSPLGAFGGIKQSGLGVEGGSEGLLEFTAAKTTYRRKRAV